MQSFDSMLWMGSRVVPQREDPLAIAIRALTEEVQQQSQLAASLQEELECAQQQLEDAEEANMKVMTRLASIVAGQARQENLLRSNSPVQLATLGQQEDIDVQPTITREGYDDALMQASKLDKQLQAMTQTLNTLLQRKEEQEEQQTAKVMECKRAFG